MKIALCISGQPRTWKRCYQSWFDAVSHLSNDIDVFYHMWNFNTMPNSAVGMVEGGVIQPSIVPIDELEEIKETLKPKMYRYEARKKLPRDDVENPIAWWTRPQFYGIKQAAFLKRKYEIQNNFEYDVVFRLRTDLLFTHKIGSHLLHEPAKPNTMYSCVNLHDSRWGAFRIGDIFYYADSFTYDQAARYYDSFNYLESQYVSPIKDYPPELAFYFYLKTFGIKNKCVMVDAKVARMEDFAKLKGHLDPYEA
jgi:hypothetical protein